MRLTQSILDQAPSFISPTDSRVLSLRNLNLTSLDAINQLQATDIYSIIDLTKNSITYIQEFPLLLRLNTLNLSNNHIRTVTGLSKLVNLEILSITHNDISLFADIEEIKNLTLLRSLYLIGNPITNIENYRLWCIWKFPKLQVLDFQRVKESERKKASEVFDNNDIDNETHTFSETLKQQQIVIDSEKVNDTDNNRKLTQADKERLESELEAAESLEEIQRIEEILLRDHL
ncbi:U2 snRNP complex subunit [Pichia californica]|uniref:U2 small nuclear ribonucleoprotein A' n=1 Tax=Pichia californica TaxID=460514 RepID=A0A9P6WJD3_9ASCO|nr:U2 snRNP complex subunit [[Candida] californica]